MIARITPGDSHGYGARRGIRRTGSDWHFDFITVAGTRLRYFESGTGTPVVLLHGNGSMIEDFVCSGILDHAASSFRFIAFDRPGFGYSERPPGREWGPLEQADLLLNALARLGVERPIVVGHSWGALVALAMALARPEDVAGLVLLSGYYYPVPRAAAIMASAASPFTSDILRNAGPCPPPHGSRHAAARFRAVRRPRAFQEGLPNGARHARVADEGRRRGSGDAARRRQGARPALWEAKRSRVHLIAGSDDRIVDTERAFRSPASGAWHQHIPPRPRVRPHGSPRRSRKSHGGDRCDRQGSPRKGTRTIAAATNPAAQLAAHRRKPRGGLRARIAAPGLRLRLRIAGGFGRCRRPRPARRRGRRRGRGGRP